MLHSALYPSLCTLPTVCHSLLCTGVQVDSYSTNRRSNQKREGRLKLNLSNFPSHCVSFPADLKADFSQRDTSFIPRDAHRINNEFLSLSSSREKTSPKRSLRLKDPSIRNDFVLFILYNICTFFSLSLSYRYCWASADWRRRWSSTCCLPMTLTGSGGSRASCCNVATQKEDF